MKQADRNTTLENIQKLWKEDAGIDLSLDETQELTDNLTAFFDLLASWDKESQRTQSESSTLKEGVKKDE